MNPFAALADQTRREIVMLLAEKGELAATHISKSLEVPAPAVSQHLKTLKESGVVQMRKQGQMRLYRIADTGLGEMDLWLSRVSELRRARQIDSG